MPAEFSPAVRAAVRIANRFLDKLPVADQEQALIALVETGTPTEAATANDVLFYQRKRNEAQLTLRDILGNEEQQE